MTSCRLTSRRARTRSAMAIGNPSSKRFRRLKSMPGGVCSLSEVVAMPCFSRLVGLRQMHVIWASGLACRAWVQQSRQRRFIAALSDPFPKKRNLALFCRFARESVHRQFAPLQMQSCCKECDNEAGHLLACGPAPKPTRSKPDNNARRASPATVDQRLTRRASLHLGRLMHPWLSSETAGRIVPGPPASRWHAPGSQSLPPPAFDPFRLGPGLTHQGQCHARGRISPSSSSQTPSDAWEACHFNQIAKTLAACAVRPPFGKQICFSCAEPPG